VDTQAAAEIQALLEGVPLPATKGELVDYARREDPDLARLLEALSDREYRSLDEVGEALAPVQPPRSQPDVAVPREESDAPPSNPPQKVLEQQSNAQNEQLERQQEKLG
jgi:hypothetical protein